MYDKILLPTDGSEGSERAAEHAVAVAERFGAELHVVYAVATVEVTPDEPMANVYDELESTGRRALEDVAALADAADVESVQSSLAEGDPHRVILDYVAEHDVDLVVMGTHGRTGLERYLIGSVTEKVVRLSEVPVLTVPLPPE